MVNIEIHCIEELENFIQNISVHHYAITKVHWASMLNRGNNFATFELFKTVEYNMFYVGIISDAYAPVNGRENMALMQNV